jgi:hypothetical protein
MRTLFQALSAVNLAIAVGAIWAGKSPVNWQTFAAAGLTAIVCAIWENTAARR